MPIKPANPCRFSNCPNTTRNKNGYCNIHQNQVKVVNNYNSKKSNNFYRSQRWRKFRHWYVNVKGNTLCVRCLNENRGPIPMKILDHIIPIDKGGKKLDSENVQSLCQACHNLKTAEDKKKYNK